MSSAKQYDGTYGIVTRRNRWFQWSVTAITPMETCSPYKCAVSQQQCTAALVKAKSKIFSPVSPCSLSRELVETACVQRLFSCINLDCHAGIPDCMSDIRIPKRASLLQCRHAAG